MILETTMPKSGISSAKAPEATGGLERENLPGKNLIDSRLLSMMRLITRLRINGIREGFPSVTCPIGISPSDPDALIDTDSGKHIGTSVIKNIVEDPSFAKELWTCAEKNMRRSYAILDRMERVYSDTSVPLETVSSHFSMMLHVTHTGALDLLFDCGKYEQTIREQLRSPAPEDLGLHMNRTILSPAAVNSLYFHQKALLLHLACLYGHALQESSGSHNGTTFSDTQQPFARYDWDWFRIHNVPLEGRYEFFEKVTESYLCREVESHKRKLGITDQNSDGDNLRLTLDHLQTLRMEQQSLIRAREDSVRWLVKQAQAEHKPIVKALTTFTGKAIHLNEVMHDLLQGASNMFMVASDLRGLSRQDLGKFFFGRCASFDPGESSGLCIPDESITGYSSNMKSYIFA